MKIINIVFIDFPKWTIFRDIPTIWNEGSITLYWEKPLIKWHARVCKGFTKWDQHSLKCNFKIFFFFIRKKIYWKKTRSCQKGTKQQKKYKENLWSMGAFRDSGAGAGLGNFWKRWVRVRRDSAIKKLLKIFLFIFLIYC